MSSSPDNAPAVALRSVSKSFGKVTALQSSSLDIRRGRAEDAARPFRLREDDAAQHRGGLPRCDAGDVTIEGQRVNEVPSFQREIGMMFQSYALFPHMSIEANVGYGLKMRGVAKTEIRRASRTRLPSSSCRASKTASRASCRAGSSSASRSRAPW